MPAARPVTLRDFLALGCESSSDGFRSYPRSSRPSCDPQSKAAAELSRSPSWSPSAFLFPKSPGALARISRTLSRRLSFWRRRRGLYDYDDGLDDDRDSCGFPSPLVSSCSASSDDESSEQDIVMEVASVSSAPVSSDREEEVSASRDCTAGGAPGAAGDDGEDEAAVVDGDEEGPVVGRRKLETTEDKQQLSPVSVLDFPFDDDDGGDDEGSSDAGTSACSISCCSFHHNYCAAANNLQGKTTKTTQHSIRRLDDGRTTTEEAAVGNLEASSSSSSVSTVDDDDANGRCAHLASTSSSCSSSSSSSTEDESTNTTAPPRHVVVDTAESEEEHQGTDDDEERRSQGHQHDEKQEPAGVDEYRLLERLLDGDDDDDFYYWAAFDEVTEWLLLDFFAAEIARVRSPIPGPVLGTTKPLDDGELTKALVEPAAKWLRGVGPQWGIGDVMFCGESALQDMERARPGWSCCVREEQNEVAADAEGLVTDWLVDDLVTELCCSGRCSSSSDS